MEAFLDGEWESICKLFTVQETPDLSTNFLDLEYYSPPTSCSNESFPVVNDEISCSSLSGWISNPTHDFLESSTYTDSSSDNNVGADTFLPDVLSCIDFSNISGGNDGSYPYDAHKDSPAFKRKRAEETNSIETPKKNARISRVASKGKKKAHSKIDEEITRNENSKENNETLDTNSDGSDVCDASEEIIETEDSNSNATATLTSTGKKRASRGAATDPQSLYARKRRMRINERLKILQSIVPNGTKVDISTMLEEAFHYVKFLQHQIRMLSSDDLWMFAPLAYNGLDIEAYRRMPPFLGL